MTMFITLRDGTTVLAKVTQYGPSARTYANRTQAQQAAAKHGGVVIHRGRPFYVRLPDTAAGETLAALTSHEKEG